MVGPRPRYAIQTRPQVQPQNSSSIAENNTEVFRILIGQVAKHRQINAVFRKALHVLGHAEAVKPVRKSAASPAPAGQPNLTGPLDLLNK